jgi:hypothetical protein
MHLCVGTHVGAHVCAYSARTHACARAHTQRAWVHLEELSERGLLEYQWIDIDPYASPDTKQVSHFGFRV